MSRLRNGLAWLLEEAARGRKARTRSSAAIGAMLKHMGLAKACQAAADRLWEGE